LRKLNVQSRNNNQTNATQEATRQKATLRHRRKRAFKSLPDAVSHVQHNKVIGDEAIEFRAMRNRTRTAEKMANFPRGGREHRKIKRAESINTEKESKKIMLHVHKTSRTQ
jgi:hypothetical protein